MQHTNGTGAAAAAPLFLFLLRFAFHIFLRSRIYACVLASICKLRGRGMAVGTQHLVRVILRQSFPLFRFSRYWF